MKLTSKAYLKLIASTLLLFFVCVPLAIYSAINISLSIALLISIFMVVINVILLLLTVEIENLTKKQGVILYFISPCCYINMLIVLVWIIGMLINNGMIIRFDNGFFQ